MARDVGHTASARTDSYMEWRLRRSLLALLAPPPAGLITSLVDDLHLRAPKLGGNLTLPLA
jgi:hypothetical protein